MNFDMFVYTLTGHIKNYLCVYLCAFYIFFKYIRIHLGNPLQFGVLVTKSCPTLVTPCSVACQAPLSTGFSRQEYWSGLPFPSQGDPPDLGIEPGSSALQADSLPTELRGKLSNP